MFCKRTITVYFMLHFYFVKLKKYHSSGLYFYHLSLCVFLIA